MRSVIWAAVKVSYFSRHPKRCWICGTDQRIALHHVSYDRIGGQERDEDLLPLCAGHHRGLHNYMKHHRTRVEIAHIRYKAHLASPKPRKKKKRVARRKTTR